LKDSPLQTFDSNLYLSAEAIFLVKNSLARSTHQGYDDAVANYEFFAKTHGYRPFPALTNTTTYWLAHFLKLIKVNSAQYYLCSIKNYHLEHGLPLIDDFIIDKVLREAKQVYN
jgi:hypothetical protein